jgi:hypothetical protein
MKSFLGGLALAAGMALLNGATTPAPSLCLLLPDLEPRTAVEYSNDDCSAACARRRRNP